MAGTKPSKLTAQTVENAWRSGAVGRYYDTANVRGMFFEVTGVRAGSFWVRTQVDGKRSVSSVGAYPSRSLAEARVEAAKVRKVAKIDKLDPVADRRAKESEGHVAAVTDLTVYELIEKFAEVKAGKDWKPRTQATFRDLMKLYLPAKIGNMRQKHVPPGMIWNEILKPIWQTKPGQALRVYKYLAMLYDYGQDLHDSPHNLRRLTKWMPKQPKGGHYKGLEWQELPAFFAKLHHIQNTVKHNKRINPERREKVKELRKFMSYKAVAATLGISTSGVWQYVKSQGKQHKTFDLNFTRIKALMTEFIFLCGAPRIGMTVAIQWSYIDEENALLVIPRTLMKNDQEERGDFVIPLVPRAMKIVHEMKAYRHGDYLFPGRGRYKPVEERRCLRGTPYNPDAEGPALVPTILWSFLKQEMGLTITIHGARRTIKNWATAQRWVQDITAELALDHKYEPPRRKYRDIAIEFTLGNVYGTKIENVYRDEPIIQERREMLEAFANYCLGTNESNVIQLPTPIARNTA